MKKTSIKNDLTKNRDTLLFVETAKKYCSFIENHKFKRGKSIYELVDILLNLYIFALRLPKVRVAKKHHDLDYVDKKEYTKIAEKLFKGFVDFKFYWLVFNPLAKDEDINDEVVRAGVYDDLADIYRDVKNGLLEYQKHSQENVNDAIWHWRFHFYTHWGDHLVRLLKPLNQIIEDNYLKND